MLKLKKINVMKTMSLILIAIFFIAYSGKPTISLSPFNVSFERPYLPFALLFLTISIALFELQYEKIGYKKGVSDSIEVIKEVYNDDNK